MNDRRNELNETEIGKGLDRINQAIEPHSKAIVFGLVVLVALAIGWALYSSEQTGKRSLATFQLINAAGEGDAENLQRVTSTFPDTIAAGWAALFRGDETFGSGVQQLFQDRDAALAELDTAEEAYRQAKSLGRDALLISRANLGLAKVAEARGEAEKAIEAYREVIAAGESEQMKEYAEGRIEVLKRKDITDFLAWFNEQDFAAADPSLPPSLPGMGALPGLPDLKLPELTLSSGEDDEAKKEEEKADAPKADETKADAPKTDEAKSETVKPSDAKPDDAPAKSEADTETKSETSPEAKPEAGADAKTEADAPAKDE
jgi:predicted negative regulator of RcsB-dependent stress response